MYFLSVVSHRVRVCSFGWPKEQDWRLIESVEDFEAFMASEAARLGTNVEDLRVSVSSSMDFPEDETNNPETIALAKALRS